MGTDPKIQNKQTDMINEYDQAFAWANEAMKNTQWSKASARWATLRKAYPENPDVWFNSVDALLNGDEVKEAIALMSDVEKLFPKHPFTTILLAKLALTTKKNDEANKHLKKAQEVFSDVMETWVVSAILAENENMLSLAEEYYEHACRCAPDNHSPYILLAEMYMRAEEWKKALHRWEIVRDKFPDDKRGYLSAAEAANKLNNRKLAKKLLLQYHYGKEVFDENLLPQKASISNKLNSNKLLWLIDLVWTKAIFNLKSEINRNYLSYAWWVIEPLLHMIVYYIVFGLLLKRGGDNFSTFLLIGLIPWMWFMKTVSSSSNSIIMGANLLLQIRLPSIIFPLIILVQSTLKQIPAFMLLVLFLWVQGYHIGYHWIMLLPVILVQLLLIVVFACSIAAIIPFVRDLSYLVPTGLTFMMFLSGIFYDYHIMSPKFQKLFFLNPMALVIASYRGIFMEQTIPDIAALSKWGVGCIVGIFCIIILYRRLNYIYPRIL